MDWDDDASMIMPRGSGLIKESHTMDRPLACQMEYIALTNFYSLLL